MPYLITTFNKDEWNGGNAINVFTVQTKPELIQLLNHYQKKRGFTETIKTSCNCNVHFVPFFGTNEECNKMMSDTLNKYNIKFDKNIKSVYEDKILNCDINFDDVTQEINGLKNEVNYDILKLRLELFTEQYDKYKCECNYGDLDDKYKIILEINNLTKVIRDKTFENVKDVEEKLYEIEEMIPYINNKIDENSIKMTRHLITIDDINNNTYNNYICKLCNCKCTDVKIVEMFEDDYYTNIFDISNFSKIIDTSEYSDENLLLVDPRFKDIENEEDGYLFNVKYVKNTSYMSWERTNI